MTNVWEECQTQKRTYDHQHNDHKSMEAPKALWHAQETTWDNQSVLLTHAIIKPEIRNLFCQKQISQNIPRRRISTCKSNYLWMPNPSCIHTKSDFFPNMIVQLTKGKISQQLKDTTICTPMSVLQSASH